MKQSLAYMAGIRLSASMSMFQHYSRNDILRLLEHIDALESELNEAKKTAEEALEKLGAAGRELNEVKKFRDSFRKENDELSEEISELKRQKPAPVVLPKDVAEALEDFRKKSPFGDDPDYVAWKAIQYNDNSQDINLNNLKEYANQRGVFKLVNALQYGYTVEEPIDHKELLRIDIERLVTTWDRTRPTSSLVKDIDERLNDYFQEIAK